MDLGRHFYRSVDLVGQKIRTVAKKLACRYRVHRQVCTDSSVRRSSVEGARQVGHGDR